MAGSFRDLFELVLGWRSSEAAVAAEVSERFTLDGADSSRLLLDGTNSSRLTLDGTSNSRITLVGTQ